MSAPVITLQLAAGEQTVKFNMARMVAIEAAMENGSLELAAQISAYLPATRDGANGQKEADPESVAAIVKSSRLTVMARFVAACLGIPLDQLETKVGASELWSAFYQLAVAFMSAVMDLQGVKPEPAGKAPAPQGAASDGSAPGPASSSASEATSSASSAPPTSGS